MVGQRGAEPMDVNESLVDDGQYQRISGREMSVQRSGADARRARHIIERSGHTVASECIPIRRCPNPSPNGRCLGERWIEVVTTLI
jgi:hypothetical protein